MATLTNADLTAALEKARADEAGAEAERAQVYSGVRAEEIEIAEAAVRTAEAHLALAREQNFRASVLSAQAFASQAQVDNSVAALAKAEASVALKQAALNQAKAGPTAEEKVLADVKVAMAKASVESAQARVDKLRLVAPSAGRIGVTIAQRGEVATPGKPILTLEPDGGEWFAFTVREDRLGRLRLGSLVELSRDVGAPLPALVTELTPLGEFATWRAARAVGDHDLNSFQLRLEPATRAERLEPGMTVALHEER